MFVLIIFSILALFFTYLESMGLMKHGLWIGLFLVTIVAAIRYYVGSDYPAYYQMYMEYIQYKHSLHEILFDEVRGRSEPGWLLFMTLFKPLGVGGFYAMIAFLSLFQGIIIYFLIKRYLPPQFYVLALFIYLFNVNIYVGSLSGLRQHFAVAIIACALPWILDKKWLRALLIIFIATTVHKSAFIFIPFAFWGFIPNNRKLFAIIYTLLFLALFISNNLTQGIIDQFFKIEELEQSYMFYTQEENNVTFGLGFIIGSLIPLVLSLIYIYTVSDNREAFKIVALATIYLVMIPITTFVHLGDRMAYYFEIFSIISIPYCFSVIHSKHIRIPLTALYMFVLVYSYYRYFHTEVRYESTYFYHSIFEFLL